MTWHERLAAPGVWQFTDAMAPAEAREAAARIESLGYSAQWFGEAMARHAFVNAANLLHGTERLIVATGIAGIQLRTPFAMKAGAHDLAQMSGGRFVLGVGVSHAPLVEGAHGQRYDKPLSTMRDYLAAMESSMVITPRDTESPPVVLAALGPRMLALAGEAAQGAHPYWTTPEHTAQAREIMGPDALLCVEQKCVLTTDKEVAHARAADQLGMYRSLPNYRNNWLRLGFTEAEIDDGADRFVDAVVAWGTDDQIAERIRQHYDAGATHVCVQAVRPDGTTGRPDWDLLEALAPGG